MSKEIRNVKKLYETGILSIEEVFRLADFGLQNAAEIEHKGGAHE